MKQKNKHVLDTSILYESLKHDQGKISEYLTTTYGKRLYGLHFTLIEFRLGLMHHWVSYYLEIEATRQITKSIRDISNSFKLRRKNSKLMLEILMHQLLDSIPTKNVDEYLRGIEACIHYANISTNGLLKKWTGSFSDHPLVRVEINSSEDYEEFTKLCNQNSVVDIEQLLLTKKKQLTALKHYLENTTFNSKEKKYTTKLIKLVDLAINTPEKSNMISNNVQYGDIVIGLDTPKQYQLVSKDLNFKFIGEGTNTDCVVDNFDLT